MKNYLRLVLEKLINIVEKIEKIKIKFLLPFIINTLDITLPEGSEKLVQYSFGVLILSLITLICFINVFGYFISLYLIQKYDIERNYSKLRIFIKFFEKSSLVFIVVELIFGFSCLLFLIISAFMFLKNITF